MEDADFGEDNDYDMYTEDVLDPNNPDDAFAIVERDYTKICAEMEEDPNLNKYVDEFNKLFDFLYKTRETAVEYEMKNNELEESLAAQNERLDTSLKIVKVDEQTIRTLKEEITNSHKMLDNAHAREQAAQEVIDNLRKQIGALNAEIDLKNKLAEGELEENPQVAKHREGLEREKQRLLSEVSKLNEKLTNTVAYQEELERRNSAADLKINEITVQLEESVATMERAKKAREKLESDIEEMAEENKLLVEEIAALKDTITTNERVLAKYEQHLKEQQNAAVKCFKELEGWSLKYTKMQDELDVLNYNTESLKKDYQRALQDIKVKDLERQRLSIDIAKMTKQREITERVQKHLEDERGNLRSEMKKLRTAVAEMEMNLKAEKRQVDDDRRLIEDLHRERDIISRNLLRSQNMAKDQLKLIKIQEQTKNKLETEIDSHVIEGRKQRKQISYLEKERDRLLEEELELTRKIEDTMDEVKMAKNHVADLKKTVAENENKLRTQQNLFDAVRADRSQLQKSLQECSAEGNELKRKLKIGIYQSEQLKEDISMKEQLLIKEETILRKIIKEKENMKIELNVCWDNIRALKEDIVTRKTEEKRLHNVIATSDRTIREQSKTLTQLMNERDVLGAQLVRRNDELSLLYEKIMILQTTLHRGQAQYEQRLQDIKLLKVEIKRLRQEKILLTSSIKNMNDLKQEVFHLERDLTKERLKTKALEDELQNPMNIHRWRKLEGSDPEVFELLQKITLLQKRLLRQASVAIDREKQLKESEKLYVNLRQVVTKQPGPEIKARLVKTQKALTSRIRKMKCLVSELNMTEIQSKEYKMDLDKVSEDLKNVKRKYIDEKKKHTRDLAVLKELSQRIANSEFLPKIDAQPRMAGGGFKFSITEGISK